ncbi:MAG: hypothetical protein KGO52_05075 [Nitrospirota bacterium]|nr:hypothetical protein [Nitrospirota bacterium]MDE3242079.1 hypothetical protein [Nitrospirota bacterium]
MHRLIPLIFSGGFNSVTGARPTAASDPAIAQPGGSLRIVTLLTLLLCLAAAGTGCQKISKAFTKTPIPSLGNPLPYTVKMEFDPTLTKARLQYTNACNSPQELLVGDDLESTLLQAAHQTFKAVYFSTQSPPSGTNPDLTIRIGLLQSGLEIQTDGVYDRLPADLTLELGTVFRDSTGKLVSEKNFPIRRQEKLILEPTQHRCAYMNSESLIHDASVSLSIQFIKHARALLDPDGQYAVAAAPGGQPAAPDVPEVIPTPPPAPVQTQPGASGLSFKATVLDENSNAILEGGERVKVRVDLVNAGRTAARDVAVTLTGTPALLGQFPATTLPVGLLQPGESRSLEFVATIPPALPAQQAQLQVAVTDASGVGAPAPQSFTTSLRAGGAAGTAAAAGAAMLFPDVDQVPGSPAGFQHPQTHVLAIGIGSYRDPLVPARKFAAQDAELVAAYFKAIGGVPASNVRILQDRKALRPDIEEAILDWLPPRLTTDSVVIVYFAGQALVAPGGETFLLPYEGGTASTTRLYPLKDLQAALAKLKAQQVVLIFDGALLRLGKDANKAKAPQWDAGGGTLVRLIGTSGLQSGLEPDQLKHGLFTYYLLRGLKGDADANRDGEVTLGELATYVRQTVPATAKSQFKQDQRPSVFPALTQTSKAASVPLARTAARP